MQGLDLDPYTSVTDAELCLHVDPITIGRGGVSDSVASLECLFGPQQERMFLLGLDVPG